MAIARAYMRPSEVIHRELRKAIEENVRAPAPEARERARDLGRRYREAVMAEREQDAADEVFRKTVRDELTAETQLAARQQLTPRAGVAYAIAMMLLLAGVGVARHFGWWP